MHELLRGVWKMYPTINFRSIVFDAIRSDDTGILIMLLDDVQLQINVNHIFFQYDIKIPLHVSAEKGYLEIVEVLMHRKCNTNPLTRQRATPLMLSVKGMYHIIKVKKGSFMPYVVTIEYMLDARCDTGIVDNKEMDVIDYLLHEAKAFVGDQHKQNVCIIVSLISKIVNNWHDTRNKDSEIQAKADVLNRNWESKAHAFLMLHHSRLGAASAWHSLDPSISKMIYNTGFFIPDVGNAKLYVSCNTRRGQQTHAYNKAGVV